MPSRSLSRKRVSLDNKAKQRFWEDRLLSPSCDLERNDAPTVDARDGQIDLRAALEKIERCLRLPISADVRRMISVIVDEALNPDREEC